VRRVLTLTALLGVLAGLALYVQAAEPSWYYRLRYPLAYDSIIRGHADNYNLDAALVAGVIYQESKFDPEAESDAGAVGLMQLRPDTARGIAERTGGSAFRIDDLTNPELNVRYGSWYLRHLLDKYDDEKLALAAFNAGQGNVDSWREQGKGIAFAETRHYVERVQELKRIYREAYADELGY
jgi:soluble lytic murein transglycosylase